MKTSVLSFFIILSCTYLNAQQFKGQSPEYRAEQKVSMLNLSLSLTAQQAEKVLQIYIKHFKVTDSLRTSNLNPGPNTKAKTSAAMMASFNKAQLATDRKIISILNTEQKVAYSKIVNSRKILVVATPVPPG